MLVWIYGVDGGWEDGDCWWDWGEERVWVGWIGWMGGTGCGGLRWGRFGGEGGVFVSVGRRGCEGGCRGGV